ncbi:PE family protein [Nocardia sp. GTS18]|uniref:PE family protein n=1 Tax=Nocardia sp. GTS18 TaxID=1778064 RepID=UPI0015EF8CB3|nr:PE family protein [Nocardia sp. GTS18]
MGIDTNASVGGESGEIRFDSVAAANAAAQLDALAQRLENDLRLEQHALSPAPAGSDAVSVRAAQTLTTVGESFQRNLIDGVLELRKIAANLRAQSDRVVRNEEISADEFRSRNV